MLNFVIREDFPNLNALHTINKPIGSAKINNKKKVNNKIRVSALQIFFLKRFMCIYYGMVFTCICFQVEAGDVILRVNEVDVNRFSTKEGK